MKRTVPIPTVNPDPKRRESMDKNAMNKMDTAEIQYFSNVTNVEEICEAVRSGNVQAAVLDASLVCSRSALNLAVYKAQQSKKDSSMKSRSVFVEIILELSGEKNVSKALKVFGAKPESIHLIFISLVNKNDASAIDFHPNVDGTEELDLDSAFSKYSDIDRIKKIYDVTENELQIGSLEDAILFRIGVRDI